MVVREIEGYEWRRVSEKHDWTKWEMLEYNEIRFYWAHDVEEGYN